MDWIMNRLKEKSTWTGLASVAGGGAIFGMDSDQQAQIVAAIVAVVGVIQMFLKEKNSR